MKILRVVFRTGRIMCVNIGRLEADEDFVYVWQEGYPAHRPSHTWLRNQIRHLYVGRTSYAVH